MIESLEGLADPMRPGTLIYTLVYLLESLRLSAIISSHHSSRLSFLLQEHRDDAPSARG